MASFWPIDWLLAELDFSSFGVRLSSELAFLGKAALRFAHGAHVAALLCMCTGATVAMPVSLYALVRGHGEGVGSSVRSGACALSHAVVVATLLELIAQFT